MSRAPDEEPWIASRATGALVVVLFAIYLAWMLTNGPTTGFLPVAGTAAFVGWLGTLAIVHLGRLRASAMIVPASRRSPPRPPGGACSSPG